MSTQVKSLSELKKLYPKQNNSKNVAQHSEYSAQHKRENAARRKREERARYTENGLINVSVRIKPEHKETLLQYVEGLNKK